MSRNLRIYSEAMAMLADLDDSPLDGDCCTPETEYACSVCVELTALAMAGD